MSMTHFKHFAIAAMALLGAQFSYADVATGSVVRLNDGTGSLGGVFNGSVISGQGTGETFLSFCLEKNETFNWNTNLYVKSVSTSTQNSLTPGNTTNNFGTTSSDPLSSQTAYLFTQFYNNQSIYAGTQSLANSLQRAVWFLEGELAGTDLNAYNSDTNATTWVAQANSAVNSGAWSGLGNVRVLNLFRDSNYTMHAQDQLYMVSAVPEPQTYALMLAGLGLMSVIARRRSKNKPD
jgi:hypothetical protein